MADKPKKNPLPAPRNRDYADGFCHSLKMLSHAINFATLRAKKNYLLGLNMAFDLAKELYEDMRAHLETMTDEAQNIAPPTGPLSEVDPTPEED